MIPAPQPEAFDVDAAIEALTLRLAWTIYRLGARVEYEPGGPARLVRPLHGADHVAAAVSPRAARAAQAVLHTFDPDAYPAPPPTADAA